MIIKKSVLQIKNFTSVSVICNGGESKNGYRHGDCLMKGKYIALKKINDKKN